ncbi:MAG: oxidoreductase [Thermoanaerobaculia bacterium]
MKPRPKLAVFKLSSCDGCQLAILRLEEDLLAIADRIEIGFFLEASSAIGTPPWDVALIEGSVTTREEADLVREIRHDARMLVAIGACATSGGIQALRNRASVEEYRRAVYPAPEMVETLDRSTPVSEHVTVDYEVAGCPVSRKQMKELIGSILIGRPPQFPTHSVCIECKREGNPCVLIEHATPCLGPITRAGCGAICPSYLRGCYGCAGPSEVSRADAWLTRMETLGHDPAALRRQLHGVSGWALPFRGHAGAGERNL